jgi:hypothetical protein
MNTFSFLPALLPEACARGYLVDRSWKFEADMIWRWWGARTAVDALQGPLPWWIYTLSASIDVRECGGDHWLELISGAATESSYYVAADC